MNADFLDFLTALALGLLVLNAAFTFFDLINYFTR